MTNQWNRRRFLSSASGTAAGLVILGDSRSVWGYHANDKLNVAVVGAGGMGAWNLAHVAEENVEFGSGMRIKPASHAEMTGENIVALCDVDERSAAASTPGRRNPPGEAFPAMGKRRSTTITDCRIGRGAQRFGGHYSWHGSTFVAQ